MSCDLHVTGPSCLSLLVHHLPFDDDMRDEAVMATKLVHHVLPPAGSGGGRTLVTASHTITNITISSSSGGSPGSIDKDHVPKLAHLQ